MTASIGTPFDSVRSTRRHAAACARSSRFGYHLKGSDTCSARKPWRLSSSTRPRTWSSAPPWTNGTCASQTRTVRTDGIARLSREPEIDDIAILDDVLFSFEPDLSVISAGRHRSSGRQTVIRNDLGANESSRDVAVDLSRGNLCGGPT